MAQISVNVFLYGALSHYVSPTTPGCANHIIEMPELSTIQDLLNILNITTEERGITFVNGNLSALPGFQPDLDNVLKNNDRVAFFDLKSMWPFQYRQGASMTEDLSGKISGLSDSSFHHSYQNTTLRKE